ncbi:MAG TPA: hypothetical protein PK854_06090 [Oscillospiraceae bacterium]|nr:hypothetical protein [Oscillospiraceae bacterium]HPS34816.1 hypothetical protein [Oscillospiraceae bacterium]
MNKVFLFIVGVSILLVLCGCENSTASVPSQESAAQSKENDLTLENGVICNYSKLVDGSRGHTLYYLETDGTLYGWGKNYNYLLGLPIPEQYYSYKPIVLATDAADVVCNLFTTYILKTDGTLWVLGYYEHATDGSDYVGSWTQIAEDVKQLRSGGSGRNICGVLKQDGSLYVLGSTYAGNVSLVRSNVEIDEFVLRPADTGVDRLGGIHIEYFGNTIESQSQVNVGVRYTVGYFKDGAYWQAIENKDGSFTLQKLVDSNVAQVQNVSRFDFYIDLEENLCSAKKGTIIAEDVTSFLSGTEGSCIFVTKDHKLWEIGMTTLPVDGDYVVYEEPNFLSEGVVKIYNASDTAALTYYILKTDGTLWCWGVNGFGLLGNGTVTAEIARDNDLIPEGTPVEDVCDEITQVLNISKVRDFCYSTQVKVAVTKSGERYIWGVNPYYRAYTDSTSEKNSPHAEYSEDRSTVPTPAHVFREDFLLVPTTWTEAFEKYGYEK